jgi:hypothetical protein
MGVHRSDDPRAELLAGARRADGLVTCVASGQRGAEVGMQMIEWAWLQVPRNEPIAEVETHSFNDSKQILAVE